MMPATPFQVDCLLVPLDGSRLAEAALPAVRTLAPALAADIVLVHILERHPPPEIHGERHITDAEQARHYLASVAADLADVERPVSLHVHEAPEGDVARSIAEHSEEFSAGLVVLGAHGRGGVRGMLFGRIAQNVLQRGRRPVLLVQPRADGSAPPFEPDPTIVPVDEEHSSGEALAAAATIGRALGAAVHIVAVVPTVRALTGAPTSSRVLLPSTMRALLDMSEEAAEASLEARARDCRESGAEVVTRVLRGDTVEAVLSDAARAGAGLIVMSSHGRAGLDALLSASVAQRIIARAACPLLLVRSP